MMSAEDDPTEDKAVVQIAGPELAPAQDAEKDAAGGADNAEGAPQAPPKENVTEKPPAPPDNKAAHGKSSGMRRKQIEAHAAPAEPLDLTCLDWHKPESVPLPADVLPDWLKRLFGSASGSPAFVSSAMAACSAAIGNAVSLPAMAGAAAATCSLRVAVVSDDRTLPNEVTAVLDPAYAIERQEVNAWAPLAQANDLQRGLLARRRRLVMTTLSNADFLGLCGLETRPDAAPEPAPPRPQFVLRDVRPAALSKAVEATRGLLVVADGKMPTLAGFATNYDGVTADVLNKAAAGEKLEIADASGVRMQTINICTIGALAPADTLCLHKATPAALQCGQCVYRLRRDRATHELARPAARDRG